jgi:hypothetical protein
MFRPTDEQQHAIELFKTGDTLRIDAYAGSGKTTTLELLAHSTRRSGYYLAFGKNNQLEAEKKFPTNVDCRTTSSLAYRVIARLGKYSNPKMTQIANANLIAEVLGLPEYSQFSSTSWLTLSSRSYASILQDACKTFLFSTSQEPAVKHFPRYKNGMLVLLTDSEFSMFANEALTKLKELWRNMQDPQGRIPLGHEGYTKLWALASPRIEADFILLDEAQDSNPVLLEVLQNQNCQVVYVGDPYQQIYEWRGAVNAMQRVQTKRRTALTQSFRFGPAIASAATKVIAKLGAQDAIRGHDKIQSDVCSVNPDAILCRTNFGVITHLMGYQAQGAACHIIGGPSELRRLLCDVKRLKQALAPEAPEFFGFKNWEEVVMFSNQPEGEYLKSFVRLVTEYGEQQLLSALDSVRPSETDCDIILSTAHKSKGREWKFVYLDSDFEKLLTTPLDSPTPTKHIEPEDARLLYVAMTRAAKAVEIPEKILKFFELTNSRADRVGTARFTPQRQFAAAGKA